MEGSLVRHARRGLVLAALAAALGLAACQNMNAFVTGEKFYRAPEGSPRMEVELIVETDEAFYAGLDDKNAQRELEDEITQMVVSLADVGMRFYPILSEDYGRKDARPAYVMVVRVGGMTINANHELIEEEGQQPRIESTVRSLDCVATASVEKRRDDAPPLKVGTGQGKGRVHVGKASEGQPAQPSFRVKRESDDHEPLQVARRDVMAAVEESVIDALRKVVKPVDRDFELARDSAP